VKVGTFVLTALSVVSVCALSRHKIGRVQAEGAEVKSSGHLIRPAQTVCEEFKDSFSAQLGKVGKVRTFESRSRPTHWGAPCRRDSGFVLTRPRQHAQLCILHDKVETFCIVRSQNADINQKAPTL